MLKYINTRNGSGVCAVLYRDTVTGEFVVHNFTGETKVGYIEKRFSFRSKAAQYRQLLRPNK